MTFGGWVVSNAITCQGKRLLSIPRGRMERTQFRHGEPLALSLAHRGQPDKLENVSTASRSSALALAVAAIGCTRPISHGIQRLSSELASAFDVAATAQLTDSNRILRVIVDLPATAEASLRVAQFARAHYDSVATIDAIEVRFQHEQRSGQFSKTVMRRGGAYLPALLPIDTTPGWVQHMLAPSPTPTLTVTAVRAATDTVFTHDGFSSVIELTDTTVDNHAVWRLATNYRSTNGATLAVDVVTLNKTTLRPIDEQRTDATSTAIIHYDGPHVTVELTDLHGGRVSRGTTFAVAPYAGSELELLLGTLPLVKDYTTRLPVFRAGGSASGLDWVSVLVSAIDTSRNAWVVEAAGTHTPFQRRWISRKTMSVDSP